MYALVSATACSANGWDGEFWFYVDYDHLQVNPSYRNVRFHRFNLQLKTTILQGNQIFPNAILDMLYNRHLEAKVFHQYPNGEI